jgi:hypothetical protein
LKSSNVVIAGFPNCLKTSAAAADGVLVARALAVPGADYYLFIN